MAEGKDVRADVNDFGGNVILTLSTSGVGSVPITLDPQSASELGEKLARAAHIARFGRPMQSDMDYLHHQIRSRVTNELRGMLARRLEVMLNSLRENRDWSNEKLARELLDTVLTKTA